jgi:hypothetical protein
VLPVVLVPETIGGDEFDGVAPIALVEAVQLVVDPDLLVARTDATMYLPICDFGIK